MRIVGIAISLLLVSCYLVTPEAVGQGEWIYLSDFSGGLNLTDAPTDLQLNEAVVMNNAVLDSRQIKKRAAFTQVSSNFSSDGVRALYRYYNGISKEFQLIAICGNAGYVSKDDGVTFTMFYSDSNVTVTNGSKNVVAPDSGFFKPYRDKYFSSWKMKLPNGVYTIASWGISTDSDPDTAYLEMAYTGTTGSAKPFQLSPFIADGYIDFETWLNRLYIADGANPIKVWMGSDFRYENAKRYYPAIDSFLIDTTVQYGCNARLIRPADFNTRGGVYQNYADAQYQIIFTDSVGTGEEVRKPIPIVEWRGSSGSYLEVHGLSRYDIDTTQYVYITYPMHYGEYAVVDSGTFERVVKIDSTYQCANYDYVDNQKLSTWTETLYNSDATVICFDNPATDRWYIFRNYKRSTSPDTIGVRISFRGSESWYPDLPLKIDSAVTHGTALAYKIIRINWGATDVMPSARFVRQQANALWAANLADAPSRVYVSEVGTDSIFGEFIFDALGWDGDEVTQLFDIYNYIYAVKSNAIVQVLGNANSNFSQNPVVYDFGLKSSQSMFQYLNGFVGYNEEGFFLFTGSQPQKISEKIYPVLRDSITLQATALIDGINAGRYFSVACPFNSTVNNRDFVFDLTTGSWSQWSGLRVGAFCMNNKVSTGDTLMYGDADSGVVYLYGRTSGSDYDLEYVGPFLVGTDPGIEKNVQRYFVEAAFDYGDSLAVSFYTNADAVTPIETDTIISSTTATRLATYIGDCRGDIRGNSVAIGVRSLSVDTLTISRLGMYVVPVREIRQ